MEQILESLLAWIIVGMIFALGYYLRNRKKREFWENIDEVKE